MLEHAGYCEWKRTSVLPPIRELQSMETDVVTAYHDLCPHDARPLGERFGTTTTETDNGSLANNGYNPSLLDGCHADSHMALQKCLQPRPFLPHSRALPIINLATTKQNGWPRVCMSNKNPTSACSKSYDHRHAFPVEPTHPQPNMGPPRNDGFGTHGAAVAICSELKIRPEKQLDEYRL